MPESPGPKSLERLIAEFVEADESGRPMDPAQLLAEYPEFAAELNDFLALHAKFSDSQSRSLSSVPADSTIARPTPTGNSESKKSSTVFAPEFATEQIVDAPTSGSSLTSNPPKQLGDYEIIEEIDRGGMGVVYKARHRKLRRIVALKLIRSGELASEEEVQRFLSEARAAAALAHPGIVQIYEVGTWNGLVFYTMEYIEGESLASMVAGGPLDPKEAIRIVYKLCDAVDFAHRAGVIHRDLKPANVLIQPSGQPIIIDFGLAKLAHNDQSLTATGQILGTPAYMTPELASGKVCEVGPSADNYALGAILYFLCAGQPAFSGPTAFDVLLQVLDRRPPKPSKFNKRVSKEVDFVCARMLEKDPAARYSTIKAFAKDLESILTGLPIDNPDEHAFDELRKWWQREPILVAHVTGIGITMAIVVIAYVLRGEHSEQFYYRMGLLAFWLAASFGLQYWVHRNRWRPVAILSWLGMDALIFTTLIAFAGPPRSMLLIGYPMMIVASGLFYQRRFTVITTALCILGFVLLGWQFPKDDFVKPDFSAIFVSGLAVVCLSVLAMINRVRGLSRFYEEPERR